MALIGKLVILFAAVALGILVGRGDVSCHVAPGALQDLRGAVSDTAHQLTGAVPVSLPQPNWDTGGYRATRDPTPLGAR